MDKIDTIKELFKAGNKPSQIAQVVGLTPQRINQILKKEGLKESNFNYSPKITDDIANAIVAHHEQGLTVSDISKIVNISAPGVRSYLKKQGIVPHIKVVNRERPCVVCETFFTPLYSDGVKKDKYKTCSKKCLGVHLSNIKTKYTQEETNKVIDLKKSGIANNKISESTGVDINKIKEIVKDNELFLTPEKAQQNAYQSKMEKDPLCMKKMREFHMEFTEEEFKNRILLLEKDVLDGKGSVSGLAPKFGLIPASVVEFLKRNGKGHLLDVGGSTPQIELREFLTSLLGEDRVIYNTRKIIAPLELDLYVPSLNLAIEYCGLYWHSEDQKSNNYHYTKMKLCNEKGIRLITVFEDEWLEREGQVKNYITSVLSKNTIKIGARETELKEVSKKEAITFLEENHIQGSSQIEAAFGLYNNGLVAVITGSKHHRQGFEGIFVLNRLAFKHDVSVSGGSSKLLKELVNYAKNSGYAKIISWSDNRYSEGNVYQKTGFVLEEESKPDYSYIDGLKRIAKQSCQKKHLLEKGAVGETEHEMARSLGYSRIYDCGKKRWSFKL